MKEGADPPKGETVSLGEQVRAKLAEHLVLDEFKSVDDVLKKFDEVSAVDESPAWKAIARQKDTMVKYFDQWRERHSKALYLPEY